jgi:HTH-type transcriptional regulator / antitoxin HigA
MLEPIVDEKTHSKALRRIEALWNAAAGSKQEAELDALATLLDAYERKRWPISPPSPVDAIKVRMEQLGWSRKDLEPLIGTRARVAEVLLGKRTLTLSMIRRIHAGMSIPADVLISETTPRLAKVGSRRSRTTTVSARGARPA